MNGSCIPLKKSKNATCTSEEGASGIHIMHELSIVENVFAGVMSYAEKNNAIRVLEISLRIGQLSGITEESLLLYWEAVSKGSSAQNAVFRIRRIPAVLACARCGKEFAYTQLARTCPFCGSIKLTVPAGNELEIDSVTIES